MELYKKYRPKVLSEVVGQPDAVRVLESLIAKNEVPHALLFTGPSGCGKTTLARILKKKVGCGDSDFVEQNSADFRGIDSVREIRARMGLAPISGRSRIYLLDEAHQLTKDAQNSLLKILEDTPDHVYFMLASTDPSKLIKTIHTRCTEVKVVSVKPKALESLVTTVLGKEKKKLPEEVIDRVVEASEGSARKALVILGQVIDLKTEEEQIDAIQKADSRAYAFELFKVLIRARPGDWPTVAKMLSNAEEEPETVRRIVLACANTSLLKASNKRAAAIINAFRDPFYDDTKASKAVLTLCCWEIVCGE